MPPGKPQSWVTSTLRHEALHRDATDRRMQLCLPASCPRGWNRSTPSPGCFDRNGERHLSYESSVGPSPTGGQPIKSPGTMSTCSIDSANMRGCFARDKRSDEMMRSITMSKRFSFEAACNAVAEATDKGATSAE